MVDAPITVIKSTASTVKNAQKKVEPVETVKKIRIILESNDKIPPTGQFFGINGEGYLVRAGEPVDVPPGIIDVLEAAEELHTIVDPISLRSIGTVKRLRFPYRIVQG